MDRALLTPRWIISHVLMIAAVVVMVVLGIWQLNRLDQRRDRNAEVEARSAEPVTPIGAIVSADDGFGVGEQVRFRLATATGTYVGDDEIFVRNRSLNGAPGFWLLTPLSLDDGTAVIVNRGWIPFRMGPGAPREGTEPAPGEVTVTGRVRETVTAEGLTRADGAGPIESLGRVDLERYQQELDYPILPVFLELEAQEPAPAGDLPALLPRLELGDGPHLSYAVQWFVFATIAAVGYPLVLRRLSSRRGQPRLSDIPVDYL